jgi:hypothetical protein
VHAGEEHYPVAPQIEGIGLTGIVHLVASA